MYLRRSILISGLSLLLFFCKDKDHASDGQTMLTGSEVVMTDETLIPIIEDQIVVFESEYKAKLNLVAKSETEVVNALLRDSVQVAVLARRLTDQELGAFKQRQIFPQTTHFAVDAVTLIRNRSDNDTLIELQDVIKFVKGQSVPSISGLVFDNINSSTARYIADLAGVDALPENNIFSFNGNEEAIKYIAENKGMVGVVGLNWIAQPPSAISDYINKISVLSVKGIGGSEFVSPTQNNIAENKYPLARDLFVVDCQGFAGLGRGFSAFIAGERGQRIILKSGLLPVRIPGRKIITRNQIQKNQ